VRGVKEASGEDASDDKDQVAVMGRVPDKVADRTVVEAIPGRLVGGVNVTAETPLFVVVVWTEIVEDEDFVIPTTVELTVKVNK